MGRGQTTVDSRAATQSNVAADSLSRGVGERTARHCVLLMKSRLLLSLTHTADLIHLCNYMFNINPQRIQFIFTCFNLITSHRMTQKFRVFESCHVIS